jgi:hypothetical protein
MTSRYGDNNERAITICGGGYSRYSEVLESEIDNEADANYDPGKDDEDSGSSDNTIVLRTRSQSTGTSLHDPEASIFGVIDDVDSSSSLTQLSDEDDSSSLTDRRSQDITSEESARDKNQCINCTTDIDGLNSPVLVGESLAEEASSVEYGDDDDEECGSSSEDASWMPKVKRTTNKTVTSGNNREPLPSDEERDWLRSVYAINDNDIQKKFETLRFPYFPDPLPVGAPIPGSEPDAGVEDGPANIPLQSDRTSDTENRKSSDYYDAS